MLSHHENELLTAVGLDQPLGQLFQHFWIPVLLASELPAPDCTPVKFSLLGEQLVAFRDTENRIGILDQYCAHRRANLFWGRNEECGLRCAYHGWKYDVNGNCVDIPNAPEGSAFKEKVKTRSFLGREGGGVIWVYMGPKESVPELPKMGWVNVPASHRYAVKVILECNWLQALEGDVDSSHVSFLHSTVGDGSTLGERAYSAAITDKQPDYHVKQTPSGLRCAAQRIADEKHDHWRVSHFMMPCFAMPPSQVGQSHHCNVRVPIENERTVFFRIMWNPDRPLSDKELYECMHAGLFFPEVIPGTFKPKENKENNYLIDRSMQKTYSFTGIKSLPAQDWAVVEDQGGPVLDRTRERLCSSDAAIIGLRRRLLTAIQDAVQGQAPPEAQNPNAYNLRPIEIILPNNVSLEEGASEYVNPGA